MADAAAALFVACGLDPKVAAQVSVNAKVSAALRDVIGEAGVTGGCDKSIGNLLYATATKARLRRALEVRRMSPHADPRPRVSPVSLVAVVPRECAGAPQAVGQLRGVGADQGAHPRAAAAQPPWLLGTQP